MGRFLRRLPRRLLKLIGWTLLVVILLLLTALDIARKPAGRERLRKLVLDQTAALVPGLRLGAIAGDFTSELTLLDLTLDDRFGGEAIHVDRLTLRYQLGGLVEKRVVVEAIELEGPRITLKKAKSGKLNLAELVVPSDEPDPPEEPSGPLDWTVRLDRLEITRGQVTVAIDPKQVTRVRDLELRLAAGVGPGDNVLGAPNADLRLQRLSTRVELPDGKRVGLRLAAGASLARQIGANVQLDATLDGRPIKLKLAAKGPLSKLDLDLDLDLPGKGKLEIDGWAGLSSGKPAYDLEVKLQRINARAALPSLPATNVNLTVSAKGEGVPLAPSSKLTAALDVSPSGALGYKLDATTVRASLTGKRWTLARAAVRVGRTRLEASGAGDLNRFSGKLTLRAPQLAELPLPKGGPRISGALRLATTATGALDGNLRGRIKLEGTALAVDQLTVGSVSLDTRLDRVPLAARGNVQALLAGLRGAIKLTASGVRQGGERLVDEARVEASGQQRSLTLAVNARGPQLAAELEARAAVSGQRVELDLRRLKVKAAKQRLALRNQPRLRYGFARGRVELPRTELALLGGLVTLEAKAQTKGTLQAEAKIKVSRVRPLPEGPRISATVDAQLGRKEASVALDATLAGVRRGISLAGRVPLRQRRGAPALDERRELALALDVPHLPLWLAKAVAPAQAKQLSGGVGLKARVSGSVRDPKVALDLTLAGIGYRPRVKQLDGTIALRGDGQRVTVKGSLSLERREALRLALASDTGLGPLLSDLRRRRLKPEALPLHLSLDVPGLPLKTIARAAATLLPVQRGDAFVKLQAKGTLGSARVTLRAGLRDAVLDERKLGTVEGRVDLEVAPSSLAARIVALENGQPLLRLDARTPLAVTAALRKPASLARRLPKLPLTVDGAIPSYSLARLRRLDPALGETAGTLHGRFTVRGTVGAPRAEAKIALERAVLDKVELGDLTLDGSYRPAEAKGTVRYLQRGTGGSLAVEGKLALASKQLAARIKAQRLDLGPLRKLVPAIRQSAGKLAIDLSASGKLDKPQVRGTIRLDRGTLRLAGLPAFSDLGLELLLAPERVRLKRLHLRSKGTLTATGDVALDKDGMPRSFALDAKANDFNISAGSIRNAVYNGPIKVRGKVTPTSLEADIALIEGRLRIPQIEASRTLHATDLPKDIVFVDRAARAARLKRQRELAARRALAGGAKAAAPQAMRVRIGFVTAPLFVNGKEADVEIATKLDVTVDDKGRPRIKGTVRLRRGWVKILKNRYQIDEALVQFSGNAEPDPSLNIQLSRSFPEAEIIIGLRGTLSTLLKGEGSGLELRANPPIYDRSQILALILTGRVKAVGGDGADTDKGMMVANAVAQMMLGGLMDWVGQKTGLDVASMDLDTKTTDSGETKVRAKGEFGKFLTDRIFIAYRPLVGGDADENTHEGLLEYRITARWLLMATFGNAGVGGLDLYWIYRY